jgi:uncharacterized protein YndB with AHSA1/START domain
MSVTEVERTLVKSPPELWELVDDRELMARWVAELGGPDGGAAIEVASRDPGQRLSWHSSAPGASLSVELEIAEKGWGTSVSIRAEGTSGEPDADAVLQRLLDELGSPSRRPFSRG